MQGSIKPLRTNVGVLNGPRSVVALIGRAALNQRS